jgi:methionyl-tRNA formyltransferase
MKIVVFCDSVHRYPAFRGQFDGSGHELLFVTCRNLGASLRFAAAQVVRALTHYTARDWWLLLRDLAAGRVLLSLGPLGSPRTLRFLERHRADMALHAMGVIYRRPVIERCGRGILNAHIGKLPKYRGRSVMEWSLLSGDETGVTVFFIDEGIDTGEPIVLFESIAVDGFEHLADAKRHLFAQDARLYRKAVDIIAAAAPTQPNSPETGIRFYEMSELLRAAIEASRRSGVQSDAP